MSENSKVETVDEITRIVKGSVPADLLEQEVDAILREFAKTASMKGFRAGKVPFDLIKQTHGSHARSEATQRLVSGKLHETIKEHELELASPPEVTISNGETGKDLEYSANIYLVPKPVIKGYEKLKVKIPKREATEAEIEKFILSFQESKATIRKLEFRNTAKEGDVVDLSVVTRLPGEKTGAAEPVVTELGTQKILKEVEDAIVGMTVGETKEVTIKMPEDSQNKVLRGKEITYSITLNTLSEKVLPELNDEFIGSLQSEECKTVLEFRMKAREHVESVVKAEKRSDIDAAILEELVSKNEFLVPQVYIDNEIKQMIVRSGLADPKKIDIFRMSVEPFREKWGPMALRRVRGLIAIESVGKQEGISVTESDINAKLKFIQEEHSLPESDVREYFLDESRKESFEREIFRDKTLELLRDKTEISEVAPEELQAEAEEKQSSKKSSSKKKS